MYLSLNDHGVDDSSAVIHSHEAANVYLPGAAVNINDTDVAAERVGQIGWVIVVDGLQPWFQVRRTVSIGRECQFLDSLTLARRTLNEETARLPFQVILAHFEQVG